MMLASTHPTVDSTDAALLAAADLDGTRFAAIYDRHHATVFRYVRSRLGDELVDDVVADTFIEAFGGRTTFSAAIGESCLPWLLGIATNMIARRRGAEQRWLRSQAAARDRDSTPDTFEDVDERLTALRLTPWLTAALSGLRRRDREALLLHVAGDLSIDEVARALDVPPGTVKSRLHRARRILAAQLEVRR